MTTIQQRETAELVYVDPTTVIVDNNIRTIADLDTAFLDSVREYGILSPTLGYRAEDGTIHIRAGQRRTLAARETGRNLPVIVAERGNTEAERIVEQLIENDQRTDLTPSERTKAWAQLEFEGLTVTKIAKAVGAHKDQVKAAIAVSKNDDALAVLDGEPISLLHVAACLEFADDPATHADLIECATTEPEQFEHQIERARQNRETRLKILAREAELVAEGKGIYRPGELGDTPAARLTSLEKREGMEVTAEGEPEIQVHVAANYYGELTETEYMINYRAYGYDYRHSGSGSSNTGPMTDEQKRERKRLISRNKQWDAATVVRVRWLAEFLSRKTFPKDCGAFVAVSLSRFGSDLGSRGQSLSAELLGLEPQYRGMYKSVLADLVIENPAKAGLVTLAIVLGQHESGTSRDTWRYPKEEGKHYLLQLESFGYTLSPVEKIAAGYDVPDDDEETADADVADYDLDSEADVDTDDTEQDQAA